MKQRATLSAVVSTYEFVTFTAHRGEAQTDLNYPVCPVCVPAPPGVFLPMK